MERPILYLLGAYPVWSETFLRQDLRFLLAEGVPLVPVSLFAGDVEPLPAWPEVQCLNPDRGAGLGGGGGNGSSLAHMLPRSMRTRYSLWRHRSTLSELKRLVRERDICHIHAEFADLPGLMAAGTARDTGISYSIGIHARDVHLGKYDPRVLFKEAAFVTSCNRAALDAVQRYIPSAPERTHLIYHGLDLTEWPYQDTAPDLAVRRRLLFVGRFVEKKGIDTLLRALRLLLDRSVEVSLTLVGGGPLQLDLRTLTAQLSVANKVTWAGIVQREQVRRHLCEADCLVVPSRVATDGDRDGIPNVVLEAMATGIPVVGTTVGGLDEILSERTGWLIEPDDPQELADRIQGLQREKQAVDTRRRAARRAVERRFDATLLAQKRAALFARVQSQVG